MNLTPKTTRRAVLGGALTLAAAAALPAHAQDALEDKGYALGDVVMGAEDAPVTVIEYASLTCPHCAAFHAQTWPALKADYIDTGKVRFIMREIYFDQFGVWGSMIARCGGEDRYYDLIETMLDQQQVWYSAHVRAFNQTKNPQPIVGELFRIGRRAGMSNAYMTECLQDKELLERLVSDFQTYSAEDEVSSTPTFMINGEQATGAMTPDAMAALIDKHL